MLDITIANFDQEVIAASMGTHILIDFWAPWCEPCKALGPVLEKLEVAYAGRFKLVKVDSDQEQELSQAFGIRSIPTCILMLDGKPVDGFTGALPEGKIREFLDKHLPEAPAQPPEDPLTEPELTPQAQLEKLQADVAANPGDDDARFELVRLLLERGDEDDAKVAFAPVLAQAPTVRRFDSLKRWMDALDFVTINSIDAASVAQLDTKITTNKRDFEARYDEARWLMAGQRWTDALDELLEILMRDKSWNTDLARKTYIAVLDIMERPKPKVADGHIPPDDPVLATYRRRLSSVVLS